MQAGGSVSVLASIGLAVMALWPVALPVSAAGPVTVEYPGPVCPHDGTHDLQWCIDSIEAGSTIILTSEINPDDAADITKDLTLKADSTSLHPHLDRLRVITGAGDPSIDVTVQDISVDDGVGVALDSGADHVVRLRRLVVGKLVPDPEGMIINVSVPATVVVESSTIRSAHEAQDEVMTLFVSDPDGQVNLRIVGNRLSGHGNTDSGSGIELEMDGEGSVRADILNNSIWDVARCNCGGSSGIFLKPEDAIIADVNIVGNTVDTSRTNAIGQRNTLSGVGHLSLNVFDNIFSHIQVFGFRLTTGAPGSLTFRAGHNDFYQTAGNLLDGQSAGSGNLHKDPKFVDRASGNLKLKSSSPLIDKGVVCSPGGIANLDAAGHGRLKGSSVDLGAYEVGAGTPSGKAVLGDGAGNTLDGTSGADILCGYGGKDTLKGKAGNDWLDGGSDKDTLTSGSGSDRAYGGSGNDTICANDGVNGNDRADGGSGSDRGRTDSGDTRVSIESGASC